MLLLPATIHMPRPVEVIIYWEAQMVIEECCTLLRRLCVHWQSHLSFCLNGAAVYDCKVGVFDCVLILLRVTAIIPARHNPR